MNQDVQVNLILDKQRLLKHLKEDIYCRLGVTKHGVGVIAIKDIPKDTNPFKHLSNYKKEKIIYFHKEELKDVNPNVQKIVGDFFIANNISTDIYNILYDGPNYLNIMYYTNHSSNPNLYIVNNPELSNWSSFMSSRDIKEGEELTYDYSQYSFDGKLHNPEIINSEKKEIYCGNENNLTQYKFNFTI